jgi:hypothetical protein
MFCFCGIFCNFAKNFFGGYGQYANGLIKLCLRCQIWVVDLTAKRFTGQ